MTNVQAKPKITPMQLRILGFIYRFRFLTGIQIQQLMQHSNHDRVINLATARLGRELNATSNQKMGPGPQAKSRAKTELVL